MYLYELSYANVFSLRKAIPFADNLYCLLEARLFLIENTALREIQPSREMKEKWSNIGERMAPFAHNWTIYIIFFYCCSETLADLHT